MEDGSWFLKNGWVVVKFGEWRVKKESICEGMYLHLDGYWKCIRSFHVVIIAFRLTKT